jgi:hypothetical protein
LIAEVRAIEGWCNVVWDQSAGEDLPVKCREAGTFLKEPDVGLQAGLLVLLVDDRFHAVFVRSRDQSG